MVSYAGGGAVAEVEVEELADGLKIKCSGLVTICPFNREPDYGEVEIICKPSKTPISECKLKEYLDNELEYSKIPMEAVPLKILTHCMIYNRDWLREGKQRNITVNAHFKKKNGSEMLITINFERKWK